MALLTLPTKENTKAETLHHYTIFPPLLSLLFLKKQTSSFFGLNNMSLQPSNLIFTEEITQ